jgi:hypothetical protein
VAWPLAFVVVELPAWQATLAPSTENVMFAPATGVPAPVTPEDIFNVAVKSTRLVEPRDTVFGTTEVIVSVVGIGKKIESAVSITVIESVTSLATHCADSAWMSVAVNVATPLALVTEFTATTIELPKV